MYYFQTQDDEEDTTTITARRVEKIVQLQLAAGARLQLLSVHRSVQYRTWTIVNFI